MIKTITKIGNSSGIILDAALLEMARLKAGDQVNVTVHEGGSVTLTPLRPVISAENARASARELISKNNDLFRRLS